MSGNFEVRPLGNTEEIRLSRALARAIENNLNQYGQVIPQDVYNAYVKLKEHYQWQIDNGVA